MEQVRAQVSTNYECAVTFALAKNKTYSDTPTSGLGRLQTARGVSNSRAVSAPCFRTEYGPWLGYKSARDIG